MLIGEYCAEREGKTWERLDTEWIAVRLNRIEELACKCIVAAHHAAALASCDPAGEIAEGAELAERGDAA